MFRLLQPPRHFSTRHCLTRTFTSTRPRHDFHFDTHHFVQRLEREGLNRAQAEGIMTAMAEVIDESVRNMTSNMVTKAEQEKVHVVDCLVAAVPHHSRSTTTPSKSTFAQIKSELQLDLNLEKGRLREEGSGQELKIKEASKATTLQYLVGFVTGCSALLMAYLRFRV
ncbi:DUF1640-domain-containing protein [Mycena olivaceomarginata]|nr:DUF1640-domain-containing protein [Mycena olivaceomarginata]